MINQRKPGVVTFRPEEDIGEWPFGLPEFPQQLTGGQSQIEQTFLEQEPERSSKTIEWVLKD